MRRIGLAVVLLFIVVGLALPLGAGAVETTTAIFRVLDENQQPVAGATVKATPMNGSGPVLLLTTNAEGKVAAEMEVDRSYHVEATDSAGRYGEVFAIPHVTSPVGTADIDMLPSKLRIHLVGDCGPHTANVQLILHGSTDIVSHFSLFPAPDEETWGVAPGNYWIELITARGSQRTDVTVGLLETVDVTIVQKLDNCPPATTAPSPTDPPAEQATTVPPPETTTEPPTTEPPTTVPEATVSEATVPGASTVPATTVPPSSTTVASTTSTTEPSTTTSDSTTTSTEAALQPGSSGGGGAAGPALAGVGGVSGIAVVSALIRARLRSPL